MQRRCLKCGYIHASADSSPDYEWTKCGAVYAKVEAALKDTKQKKVAEPIVNLEQTAPVKQTATGKLTKCRTCGRTFLAPQKRALTAGKASRYQHLAAP